MASALLPTTYLLYDLPGDQVTGTITSDGTVDAAYPLTNIDDVRPWKPCRFTVNPSFILWDHATPKRIDGVSFIHCGIDSATVQVKRGNTTAALSMNRTVTIPAATEDNFPSQAWSDLTADPGYNGSTGYRYTRIEFSNAALLSLGLIRLSAQLRQLGTFLQSGVGDSQMYPGLEFPSEGSVQLGYTLGVRKRNPLAGQFLNISTADFLLLQSWFRSCGRFSPCLLIPDPTQNDAWWVKWGDSPTWAFARATILNDINSLPAVWEEVGRGMKP